MKNKVGDAYITYTAKEEIEICEHCPYPLPKCRDYGCKYFLDKKAELKKKRVEVQASCG